MLVGKLDREEILVGKLVGKMAFGALFRNWRVNGSST
jgi:hypothetical protein